MREYEIARDLLAKRDAPFGLVHDFTRVTRVSALMPVAKRVLPDAIAIARGGHVRRVAIVHSFKDPLARGLVGSLAALSPVSPTRSCGASVSQGVQWAAAWSTQPHTATLEVDLSKHASERQTVSNDT